MGITPISEIRQIGVARPSPEAESVRPPFALEGSSRTEDDSYGAAHEEAERGLEEEDEETGEESNLVSEDGSGFSHSGSVNFFA
jgi:hypothetical protein